MQLLGGGSTSDVYIINHNIVKKILKRRAKGLSAKNQYYVHLLAYQITLNFKELFVPCPDSYDSKSYTMERIDTTYPVTTCNEIDMFYNKMYQHGYIPNDYELYVQPDGRIAMIDFGKFMKRVL